MTASPRDLALWLDVYDRLMAAYHAGPVGGVVTATDPGDAILAKAMEYRAMLVPGMCGHMSTDDSSGRSPRSRHATMGAL